MTTQAAAFVLIALVALTACADPGEATSASASGSGDAQTTDDASATGEASGTATSGPSSSGSATGLTTSGGSTTSTSDDGTTTGGATSSTSGTTNGGSGDESSGTGAEITGCTAAADGCCSNLLAGGTDPDCPALDCDDLQGTTPIELPSIAFPNEPRRGGTAMYWDGEVLWTARLDWVDENDNVSPDMVVFERRDSQGALLEETHAELSTNPLSLNTSGPTSLAYHEGSDRFVLAYQSSPLDVAAAGIDPDGTIAWNLDLAAQLCNGTPSRIEAFSSEAGFVIGVDEDSCEETLDDVTAVQVTADGVELEKEVIDFGIGRSAGFACGPGCDPVFAIYYDELAARVGLWSPGDGAPSETVAVPSITWGGMRYSAAVFNGETFFTLTHEWPNQNTRVQARGLWAPGEGWVGPRVTTPIDDLDARPPALLWTGHGYVAAYASFPDLPLGENVDDFDHTIIVEHFGLDGALRGSFELDPGQPGLFPQLALVDGRVATTWVRPIPPVNNQTPYERYLSFLGCE